jgi:hypothetical protein
MGTEAGGGDREALEFFGVDSVDCAAPGAGWGINRMWGFSSYTGDEAMLRIGRVRYGILPVGFIEDAPARGLEGGCFAAHVTASRGYSGVTYFRVESGGAVSTIRAGSVVPN